MFTHDLIDTSIPADVRDTRVSREGIKVDGMLYHSSVQLVKEIISRSPGKRDRSGTLHRARIEDRPDLDDDEPDALERARRRIAAWPSRGVRSGTVTDPHHTTDESRASEDGNPHRDISGAVEGHTHATRDGRGNAGRGAGSRSAERTGEEVTDAEASPVRRTDVGIDHQSPRHRTGPADGAPSPGDLMSRHDQTSHSAARHRMANAHSTRSSPNGTHSTTSVTDVTSHTTPPRQHLTSPLAGNHTPSPPHGSSTLHPAPPNHASSSSASASSFQRRFREIQSQSPGRVSWTREARGRSSGVLDEAGVAANAGEDAATHERRRSMMDGTAASQDGNGVSGRGTSAEGDRASAAAMAASRGDSTGDVFARDRRRTGADGVANGTAEVQGPDGTAGVDVTTERERLGNAVRRNEEGDGWARGQARISDSSGTGIKDGTPVRLQTRDTTDTTRLSTSRRDRSSTIEPTLYQRPINVQPSRQGTSVVPAEMSFAAIDHSTPVRHSPLNRLADRRFASSEDDETFDVFRSPIPQDAMTEEGLSRSILRRDGANGEGVPVRRTEGTGSVEDVSGRRDRNQSGDGVSRGHVDEPPRTATGDTSMQETARSARNVSFHTPRHSGDSANASFRADVTPVSARSEISAGRGRSTPRDESEASVYAFGSVEENAEEAHEGAKSYSGSRWSAAEGDERAERPNRSQMSKDESSTAQPMAQTPPSTTTTLSMASQSPRRVSRRSASPSRPSGNGTRQTSYEQTRESEESLFGVTLEPTNGGDVSTASFAPTRTGDQSTVEPQLGVIPDPLSNEGREFPADAAANAAATNAPLESAVGRHVLAWFETHKLLERDLSLAERDAAAAEQELRDALARSSVLDSKRERERDDARWMPWAAAGVVILLVVARLSPTRSPLSPADEFFYTPLQTAHFSALRFSRLPLAVRLLVYLLRFIVGERQVIRWVTWVGAGVPFAIVGRGRALHVPV